jgi:1-acyl-sn-glycerol-3-phosphate acyltransferase
MKPLPHNPEKRWIESLVTAELSRIQLPGNARFIASKIEQILAPLSAAERMSSLAYQWPFWTKRLALTPTAKIRRDTDPYQILYPASNDPIAFSGSTVMDWSISLIPHLALWQSRVANITGLIAQFRAQKNELQLGPKGGNLIILTNHIHPSDIPLLAYLLQAWSGFTKEQLYVVAGPIIFSGSLEFSAMRRFANLIKTFPDTKSADTGWEWIVKVRADMVKKLLRILKPEKSTSQQKVVIICPSGTHDKRSSNGEYTMALPSRTTPHMITSLWRPQVGSKVIPLGIYGSPLLSNFGVQDPRQVHIWFGKAQDISPEGVSEVLQELPSCVQNGLWKQIAHWAA